TAPKAMTDSARTRSDGKFITNTMGEQLAPVFEKMEQPILLKAYLDDTPLSYEVEDFLKEIGSLTNKVKFITIKDSEDEILYPSIQICDSDGLYKGAAFHGVPGGHEINSFIIALYNAAGPGQAVDEEILNRIGAIDKKIDIKIMVSLSCTMCPELVMAAQRIALENKNITAEVYDLAHYKSLKDKYNIMSVPCFVINDDLVLFGKKSISEILDILEEKV
ncbi:MAG: thioredoxin family protein, partial [Lachnospiraceae bacterium]